MTEEGRVAVLMDCDNISWRLARAIISEAATHGTLSVKRAYGDWSSDLLKNWRIALPHYGIQPVQQPSHARGKNSTDSALIIDAMDLLYADNVGTFCIVSSDSDFTRLAMRLREAGRRVYGIGEKKTPPSFRNACDRFTFIEILTAQGTGDATPMHDTTAGAPAMGSAVSALDGAGTSNRAADENETKIPADPAGAVGGDDDSAGVPLIPDIKDLIVPAIRERARPDGWALLANVGGYIVNIEPLFDSRNYGYAKLGPLVSSLPFVEAVDRPDANNTLQRWIRLRE